MLILPDAKKIPKIKPLPNTRQATNSYQQIPRIRWGKTSATSDLSEILMFRIDHNLFTILKNGNTDLFSIKQNQVHLLS